MKFSWDFQQKLQYAGVVAVVTIALMFIIGSVMHYIGLGIFIFALYAMFFMERKQGYVKPWESYGFILMTFLGNTIGELLMRAVLFNDMLSLLFLGIMGYFLYISAQRDPVDIEL
jgi:hypothetical protein